MRTSLNINFVPLYLTLRSFLHISKAIMTNFYKLLLYLKNTPTHIVKCVP